MWWANTVSSLFAVWLGAVFQTNRPTVFLRRPNLACQNIHSDVMCCMSHLSLCHLLFYGVSLLFRWAFSSCLGASEFYQVTFRRPWDRPESYLCDGLFREWRPITFHAKQSKYTRPIERTRTIFRPTEKLIRGQPSNLWPCLSLHLFAPEQTPPSTTTPHALTVKSPSPNEIQVHRNPQGCYFRPWLTVEAPRSKDIFGSQTHRIWRQTKQTTRKTER